MRSRGNDREMARALNLEDQKETGVTRNMYASSGRDTDHSDIRMCSVLWSCSDNVPTNIRKSNLSCESPEWPFGAVRDRSIHLDFIGR